MLKAYDWPGNVRELENVIEYLTICTSANGEVDNSLLEGIMDIKHEEASDLFSAAQTLPDAVAAYEKQLIEAALNESQNLRDAGMRLGINASTVSRKIRQYNIHYPNTRF